jgi:mRNA interferase MazF
MNLQRGDVALVYFPHSDLTTIKLRPVLVVQADNLRTGIAQVVVAMISSNLSRAGHPSRVLARRNMPISVGSGLLMDSVVMTDNLATIELSLVNRVAGRFRGMELVNAALRRTLALNGVA